MKGISVRKKSSLLNLAESVAAMLDRVFMSERRLSSIEDRIARLDGGDDANRAKARAERAHGA